MIIILITVTVQPDLMELNKYLGIFKLVPFVLAGIGFESRTSWLQNQVFSTIWCCLLDYVDVGVII